MGVAEYNGLRPVVDHGFEGIQVHFVGPEEAVTVIDRFQGVVHDLETAGFGHLAERVVDRLLDYDLVTGGEQAAQGETESPDYSGHISEAFRSHPPAVEPVHPVGDYAEIVSARARVAEYRMVQSPAQGVGYEIRGSEIHVGDPEGYEVVAPEILL